MDIVSFITDMYVPIVIVACLIVGYILKKWVKDVDNRYIPTIVTVLGAVLGCIINKGIGVEEIIAGAVSGLASTGFHQIFKQLIEGAQADSMMRNEISDMGNGGGKDE